MRTLRTLFILGALFAGPAIVTAPGPLLAQSASPAASTWPEAEAGDVESIDAIIEALYDVISGPAGQARDWDRFRSLFIPQGRLIPSGPSQSGGYGHVVWGPDDYVTTAGASLERSGFFEVEIARRMERFGGIAHAFSTYESRRNADDAEPFARGINSIQLMYDGDRWWVMNIFWTAERPDLAIPDRYLPGGR